MYSVTVAQQYQQYTTVALPHYYTTSKKLKSSRKSFETEHPPLDFESISERPAGRRSHHIIQTPCPSDYIFSWLTHNYLKINKFDAYLQNYDGLLTDKVLIISKFDDLSNWYLFFCQKVENK